MEPKWNRDGTTRAADSCHGRGVNAVGKPAAPKHRQPEREPKHVTLARLSNETRCSPKRLREFCGHESPHFEDRFADRHALETAQSTAIKRECARWGSDSPPWGQHTSDFASKTSELVVTLEHRRPVHPHTDGQQAFTASQAPSLQSTWHAPCSTYPPTLCESCSQQTQPSEPNRCRHFTGRPKKTGQHA